MDTMMIKMNNALIGASPDVDFMQEMILHLEDAVERVKKNCVWQ
jgi:uncharacterized protein (DUF305 family)